MVDNGYMKMVRASSICDYDNFHRVDGALIKFNCLIDVPESCTIIILQRLLLSI